MLATEDKHRAFVERQDLVFSIQASMFQIVCFTKCEMDAKKELRIEPTTFFSGSQHHFPTCF